MRKKCALYKGKYGGSPTLVIGASILVVVVDCRRCKSPPKLGTV